MGLNRRYISKGDKRKVNNSSMIVLIILVIIFFVRIGMVLKRSNERGGYAYVQLLNFGMPIVHTEVYKEEGYAENKLSIKQVCLEALELNNISSLGIVKSEVKYFNQGYEENSQVASIKPFSINDEFISKVSRENTALDPSLKKNLDNSKPEVLIYHTHTTENYAEAGSDTEESKYNVVGVGDELARILEEDYGISVIHDRTNHSISYNNSYDRSRETVAYYLNKYGDFKIIVDLHRDSTTNKDAMTANINGENVAKIMYVTTKNSPRYAKNTELAEFVYNKANELFPGLTRKPTIYNRGKGYFNQDMSDNSILIECGANINTSAEAQGTAKYIARLFAERINR